MAKKEAKLNSISIAQQLDDSLWGIGWETYMTDETIRKSWMDALHNALAFARNGDIQYLTRLIKELLERTEHHVRDCYGILHNQDVHEVWSPTEGKMVVEKKVDHGHWVIYFQQGCGGTFTELATILGLPIQQIEKTKPGRYGYDNSLAYLVHVKYTDKHQYKPEEVCTEAGRPYHELAQERWEDWLRGRSSIVRQKALNGIDDLEQRILDGSICKQQVMLTDEYYRIYALNRRRCEDAFATYAERKAFKTIQALDKGEFRLSVFFVTGAPGDGKTHLAKTFINQLIRKAADAGEEWRVCATASSNPVDDYSGEELLWMDDVRAYSMSASDWLKLLDPENVTPSSARYHNKQVACRCIVITSSLDAVSFFNACKSGGQSEALDQFIRRIQSCVQVIRSDVDLRSYYIRDSKRETLVTHVATNATQYQRGPSDPTGDIKEVRTSHYCFDDLAEYCTNLDDVAKALVDRVVINNPDVWGEQSEEIRQERQAVTNALNGYLNGTVPDEEIRKETDENDGQREA